MRWPLRFSDSQHSRQRGQLHGRARAVHDAAATGAPAARPQQRTVAPARRPASGPRGGKPAGARSSRTASSGGRDGKPGRGGSRPAQGRLARPGRATSSPAPRTRHATTARRSPRRSPARSSTAPSLAQLKGLPEKLATRVARHLAAAGMLIDERPPDRLRAHPGRPRPRRPARRRPRGLRRGRLRRRRVRRGALRAARRQADERRHRLPARSWPTASAPSAAPNAPWRWPRAPRWPTSTPAAKAEMTIVEAGARRDLGELDAALRTLENAPLNSQDPRRPGSSGCATPTPTPSLAAGRDRGRPRVVPPHRGHRRRRDHRRRRPRPPRWRAAGLTRLGPAARRPGFRPQAGRVVGIRPQGPDAHGRRRRAPAARLVVGGDADDQPGLSAGPAVPCAGGEGAAQR